MPWRNRGNATFAANRLHEKTISSDTCRSKPKTAVHGILRNLETRSHDLFLFALNKVFLSTAHGREISNTLIELNRLFLIGKQNGEYATRVI